MEKLKLIYNNILFVISKNVFMASLIIVLTIISSFRIISVTMIFPVMQSMLYNGENVLFSKYFTFFNKYSAEQKIEIILSIFIIIILLKNFLLLIKSFLTHSYEGKLINEFSSTISKKLIYSI